MLLKTTSDMGTDDTRSVTHMPALMHALATGAAEATVLQAHLLRRKTVTNTM